MLTNIELMCILKYQEYLMGIEYLPILLAVIFSVLWLSLRNEDQNNNNDSLNIKGIKMRKMAEIFFAFILSFMLVIIFVNNN